MSSSYEFAYVMEEVLDSGIIAGLFSGIPSGLFGIVTYVFTAMALYTLAKRRGLNHPWLSWVPVLDVWILGSLSDQYRYVVKGENRAKRKSLITLSILMAVLTVAIVVVAVVLAVNGISGAMYGMRDDEILEEVIGPALGIVGLSLPLAGVAIAYAVIYFMALYDVYTSCDPGNSVLFLVLSVLISVTKPFFLFFSREKDLGMPPRRQEPAYEPNCQPTYEAPQNENKDYL